MEQNTEAKLKFLLKKEKIQLWKPPYTDQLEQPGTPSMEALSQRFSVLLSLPVPTVSTALETIRAQATRRGRNNQTFRESSEATLEVLLPKRVQETQKKKNFVQTKLDITGQELVDRIMEQFGLRNFRLILSGRTLNLEQPLDMQGVRNHSKLMVLMKSDDDDDEMKSVKRTQRGFQILSERDGSEESDSTPFLEIADQRGNLLQIPEQEKKALILAMGLHEKGRSLMKKKRYDQALLHLLQADQHFSVCGSSLLSCVDNPAVLQLDIVWCFWALECLSCLEDGRSRLQRAEQGFSHSYGAQQERLLTIRGTSGREEVLYLRLFVLQSLLFYLDGNDAEARALLCKAEALLTRLTPDSEKMALLMNAGFSESEARLALRATGGNVEEAAAHIHTHRQEQEEVRVRERQRRKSLMKNVSSLAELGFCRGQAYRALQEAHGDPDQAFSILSDQSINTSDISPDKLQQLLYLGFEPSSCEFALRLANGDVQQATQLLLEQQDALQQPHSSSKSSGAPPTSSEDMELVNEALEDVSHHEDDYLDLTLEEELQLINTIRAYLEQQAPPPQ